MSDVGYDHDVPLTMRRDCGYCSHSAADHPVDLGGREAIAFLCLRSECDCRNYLFAAAIGDTDE